MKRILIIEDDRDLNQGLCLALQNSAHQIVSCFDLTERPSGAGRADGGFDIAGYQSA